MCETAELIEELQYLKEKGIKAKSNLSETEQLIKDIFDVYGEVFKTVKHLKNRLSMQCIHRENKESKKLISFGIPIQQDIDNIKMYNKWLTIPRQELSDLNAAKRVYDIELTELRSKYKDTLTQLKG